MLKFVMLKCCKTCNYKKLCSNLLSNPRGGYLTTRAEKFKKYQIVEKLKKIVKISITSRVFVWRTKTYSS